MFTEPLLVSSGYPIEHSVKVDLNKTLHFVSKAGELINPEDNELIATIPRQNTLSDWFTQAISHSKNATSMIFGGSAAA